MNALDMLIGSRVKWTHDKIKTIAQIQPRHIGRIAQFEYFADEDDSNYDSIIVMGVLDSIVGSAVVVADADYYWGRIANFIIWRSELA